VKDTYDQDVPIGASLETLVRHVSDTLRRELETLRATLDQQIASVEARLDDNNHQAAIDATASILARVTGERVDDAQLQIEATATQALAANAVLRTALDNANQQMEAAQASLVKAEADKKAVVAQHRAALSERNKLTTALDKSHAQLIDVQARLKVAQQQTEDLAAERAELQRRLTDVTTAKAAAEAQYQQLAIASQKLTEGLPQSVRTEREQARAIAAVLPIRSQPTEAPKKPLKFSERARDAKRVKIRRGVQVSVDNIPGELVDLSIGGAQATLRQMVKPNQLVQLVLQTVTGPLICKGRVVWTIYEQPGTSLSTYRAGLKFTDVNVAAIDDFMVDFGEEAVVSSTRSAGTA